MQRQCDVWDVLGYSIVMGERAGNSRNEDVRKLKSVFGELVAVRFQILRFGPQAFELTIKFYGRGTLGDTTETVAGLIGDAMVLAQGEEVRFLQYSNDSHQLCMRFWSRRD